MKRVAVIIPKRYVTSKLMELLKVISNEYELIRILEMNGLEYIKRDIYGKRDRERILHKRYNSRKK